MHTEWFTCVFVCVCKDGASQKSSQSQIFFATHDIDFELGLWCLAVMSYARCSCWYTVLVSISPCKECRTARDRIVSLNLAKVECSVEEDKNMILGVIDESDGGREAVSWQVTGTLCIHTLLPCTALH